MFATFPTGPDTGNMPPVANDLTPWSKVLSDAVAKNKRAGKKPDSARSLGTVYAAAAGIQPTSGQSLVKKIRAGRLVPSQPQAQLFSQVLGVPVDSLPPWKTRDTITSLRADLEREREFRRRVERVAAADLARLQKTIEELRAELAKTRTTGRQPPEMPKHGSRHRRGA